MPEQTVPKPSRIFPLRSIGRLTRRAGAKRVSKEALEVIRQALLDRAEEIIVESIAAARHARRVTVKVKDVQLAVRK